MTSPVPGGQFAGYDVLSLLGRGGMGSVYLVRNPHLDRREALKVLTLDAQGDFAVRFAAEARTVASLDHPGIVTVYHHGITDGVPWFTMQYLEGRDLTAAGPLPLRDVAAIVRPAAQALDYAHGRGVVHRDIKPANLQVRRDAGGAVERVTVLDFGIARLAGATSLTAVDSFVGTLTYAAPETVSGRRDVPAADQYALACTAYELLTGEPPFAGLPAAALLHAQLSVTPPPISARMPALAGLDPVFARAFAKDPAQRYPSCSAFAAALATGADPVTRRATRISPVPPYESTPAPATRGPVPPPPSAPRPAPVGPAAPRRGRERDTSTTTIMLAVVAILIGLGVIAGALILWQKETNDTSAPPAPASTGTSTTTSTTSDAPKRYWGMVVSPQGKVVRFKDYSSSDALLSAAAGYGFNESWGYTTFTSGCAAVAHVRSGSASSAAYYTATGDTRPAASENAVQRSESATGKDSEAVSTLCVGDSF